MVPVRVVEVFVSHRVRPRVYRVQSRCLWINTGSSVPRVKEGEIGGIEGVLKAIREFDRSKMMVKVIGRVIR